MNDTRYFAGIGCRRNCPEHSLRELLERSLEQHGLQIHQLNGLASIDIKRDEAGLLALATTLNLPLQFFTVEQLATFSERVTPSTIVEHEVGSTSVAEASALAAAEMFANRGADLIIRKCQNADTTVAVAYTSPYATAPNPSPLPAGEG